MNENIAEIIEVGIETSDLANEENMGIISGLLDCYETIQKYNIREKKKRLLPARPQIRLHAKKASYTVTKSRRPFLLNCGHNMCENCIYENRNNFACCICLQPTGKLTEATAIELPLIRGKGPFNVRNHFALNFFLMGELVHLRFYRETCDNYLPNCKERAQSIFTCDECDIAPSDGNCMQCSVHFCSPCFRKVHANSKVLQSHKLSVISEEQFIPVESKICRKHRITCDIRCMQCSYLCCVQCAREYHKGHRMKQLSELNAIPATRNGFDHLVAMVEKTHEGLKTAQKNIRLVQANYEDFGRQTLGDICAYFLDLHSFLQLEQQRVLAHFNSKSFKMQKSIRRSLEKLTTSLQGIDKMRMSLECHRISTDEINLRDVIHKYTPQLQMHQLDVEVSKIETNPFVFEVTRDLREEFSQYYRSDYIDPQLKVHIASVYMQPPNSSSKDMLTAIDMDAMFLSNDVSTQQFGVKKRNHSDRNMDTNKKATRENDVIASAMLDRRERDESGIDDHRPVDDTEMDLCVAACNNTTSASGSSIAIFSAKSGLWRARITEVLSPEHFYIQCLKVPDKLRELSANYVLSAEYEKEARSPIVGYIYMTYNKLNKLWYRSMLQKLLPGEVFEVFLVDVGISHNVDKNQLCEMDKQSALMPFAAIRCALHSLQPVANVWNEVATELLKEMTQNQPVTVSIVDTINNIKCNIVDIFTTHTSEVFSVRDAFLYTGMARERPDAVIKSHLKISPMIQNSKRMQQVTKFAAGQSFMVKVMYIESPHEFYVIQSDQCAAMIAMRDKLNEMYGSGTATAHEQLFWAAVGQWCATYIDNNWHRARVEELAAGEAGRIGLRLADSGKRAVVFWRKMYALKKQFMQHDGFAIRCQLAGVEPLRANNYAWTEEGVREFTHMTSNPSLQMTVYEVATAPGQPHTVTLHICRRNTDVNVGEVLAKYRHCQVTGAAAISGASQRHRDVSPPAPCNVLAKPLATAMTATATVSRSPIRVVHVVHPGEFYVEMLSLRLGIVNFHAQIQSAGKAAAAQRHLAKSDTKWLKGAQCLVYTDVRGSVAISSAARAKGTAYQSPQWQRGIITSIENDVDPERPFVIVLRDIGETCAFSGTDLYTIDPELSRVSSAVIRCHLASVKPTGGLKPWSSTAIDCFNHWIAKFTELSVTMHGLRDADTESLPVVLWATTVDASDPLAPSVTKHSNFNRALVKAGLAHQVEPMDTILKQECAAEEISIKEWYSQFDDNALFKAITSGGDVNDAAVSMAASLDDAARFKHACEAHLKDINMTPTAPNSKAPAAWLQPLPIEKTLFTAYVTYVDNARYVYLHDVQESKLLAKIASTIQSAYGKPDLLAENRPEIVYGPGQACLARYHRDKKIYRGIVDKLNNKAEYNVYFIDYGNTESVCPSEMQPYAPFAKMPAIASKFRIAKLWRNVLTVCELDVIHKYVVDQRVSVRVPANELSESIKACEIRVDNIDLVELFKKSSITEPSASSSPVSAPLACCDADDENDECSSNIDFDTLTTRADRKAAEQLELEKKKQKSKNANKKKNYESSKDDDDYLSAYTAADDIEDAYTAGCIKTIMQYHYDDPEEAMPLPNSQRSETSVTKSFRLQQASMSKTAQIFPMRSYSALPNHLEYTMRKEVQMLQGTANESLMDSDILQRDVANIAMTSLFVDDDDDDDCCELEKSFARIYCHNSSEHKEEPEEQMKQEPQPKPQQQEQEPSQLEITTNSFKENFIPEDTSSVVTHFSGMDRIKQGQLPYGRARFFCQVVYIVSSTMMHILPHFFDNEFRDTELMRRIAYLETECKPLDCFDPGTVCVGLYSADKKWYRALIRSYNPVAKTVDVIYVDYLNSETLPITAVKQCPPELLKCPQRTVSVRLHGLKPNPRVRDLDLCRELEKLCAKGPLVAKIKKRCDNDSSLDADAGCNDEILSEPTRQRNTTEIELYESETAKLPIYESLVQKNYYSRI